MMSEFIIKALAEGDPSDHMKIDNGDIYIRTGKNPLYALHNHDSDAAFVKYTKIGHVNELSAFCNSLNIVLSADEINELFETAFKLDIFGLAYTLNSFMDLNDVLEGISNTSRQISQCTSHNSPIHSYARMLAIQPFNHDSDNNSKIKYQIVKA